LELGLGGVGRRKNDGVNLERADADLPHMEMPLHGRNLVTLPYVFAHLMIDTCAAKESIATPRLPG